MPQPTLLGPPYVAKFGGLALPDGQGTLTNIPLGDRSVYVVTGSRPGEWAPPDEWAALPPVDLAARIFEEVDLFEGPTASDGRPCDGHHVLAGSLGADGRPGLALIGRLVAADDLEVVEARIGDSPLLGGAMRDWAHAEGIHFAPAPSTVAGALPYALDCARRYIRESWAACGVERLEEFRHDQPGGRVPPSAPPYHAAVLTATGLQTLEVPD
jgi:hypothetical protein